MNIRRHLTALALLVGTVLWVKIHPPIPKARTAPAVTSKPSRPIPHVPEATSPDVTCSDQQCLNAVLIDAIKHSDQTWANPKDAEKVRALLEQGADPNARDTSLSSVSYPPTALVVLLQRYWERPPTQDERMEGLAHQGPVKTMAVENYAIAKALIENGADVNVRTGKGKELALYRSCVRGDEDTVRLMLDYGANVNAKDAYGHTPLMYMAGSDSFPVMKLLVERGARVNARDGDGRTPLFRAVWGDCPGGKEATLRYLLSRGAKVNARDYKGETPLMGASDLKTIKALVKLGANVNARSKEGNTALKYVIKNLPDDDDLRAIVKVLKQAGAKE